MKKKLLCLSAILAMTSTTMVSFANEVTNYISEDNKNEMVQPRAQYAVVNASNVTFPPQAVSPKNDPNGSSKLLK